LPEHNVTELYYNNGKKFLEQGMQTILDTQAIGLNKKQTIQYECIKNNTEYVNKKKLSEWLDSLEYPLIHLDFETINPAIPLFDGTSPYEQVPFQYSIHIEHKDKVEHFEFLGDGINDPRKALVDKLSEDIPEKGTVLAHNMSFERRVLQSLKNSFTEHEEPINKIIARLEDTITPFRKFWYYDPKQHGSCSIKYVLPALTEMSYEGMEVANGTEAQRAYEQLAEKPELREPMLEYCKQDTQAMIDILRSLKISITN
jgi:hypothetical protein